MFFSSSSSLFFSLKAIIWFEKQGGKLINKVNGNLKESSAYNFYSCIFDQAKEQGLKWIFAEVREVLFNSS